MKHDDITQIVLIVDSNFDASVLKALRQCGISHFYSAKGRQVSLRERMRVLRSFSSRHALSSQRSEMYRFFVPLKYVERLLNYLSETLNLRQPGRGTIFAEKTIQVSCKTTGLFDETCLAKLPVKKLRNLFSYHCITCIVPRGMADAVVRSVLEAGLCVPMVLFGEGVGLRQKLGLIRVAIPVDKEVMYFLLPSADSPLLVELLRKAARLDHPGQGILFTRTVQALTVNMQIYHDSRRHPATMDQIISVLDEMHGSTDWRNRLGRYSAGKAETGEFCNISIICNEGTAEKVVQVAMNAGAGGATKIDLNNYLYVSDEQAMHTYQTREICDMVVARSLVDDIVNVIAELSFFEAPYDGILDVSVVETLHVHRMHVRSNARLPNNV